MTKWSWLQAGTNRVQGIPWSYYRKSVLLASFFIILYIFVFSRNSYPTHQNNTIEKWHDVSYLKRQRPSVNTTINLDKLFTFCNPEWLRNQDILAEQCLHYLARDDYLYDINDKPQHDCATIRATSQNDKRKSGNSASGTNIDKEEEVLEESSENIEEKLQPTETDFNYKPHQPANAQSNITLYHIYWKGNVTRKLAIVMKSFLYTQPLDRSKLMVWLHIPYKHYGAQYQSEFMTNILPYIPKYIELRVWNTKEQIQYPNSPWNVDPAHLEIAASTVAFSDVVRFILLERYGGVYVDGDVILLRDFTPLLNVKKQFAYYWSAHQYMNTAVLVMHPGSTILRLMIAKACLGEVAHFHPYNVTKISWALPVDDQMLIFPVPMFDPLWLKDDGFQPKSQLEPNLRKYADIFNPHMPNWEKEALGISRRKRSPAEDKRLAEEHRHFDRFFYGAYAYHWHNNWAAEVYPTSWMGILERTFNTFVEGTADNQYSEYAPYIPPENQNNHKIVIPDYGDDVFESGSE